MIKININHICKLFSYLFICIFLLSATKNNREIYAQKYLCQDSCSIPWKKSRASRNMISLGKKIANENHIFFINEGTCDLADAQKGTWCLNFLCHESLTKEQASSLIKEVSFQMLASIYRQPCFRKYIETSFLKEELNDYQVCFKLAFWDENMNRPLYPYLAQVRLADGYIYYHYADPSTQALQEPIKESLNDLQLPNYK